MKIEVVINSREAIPVRAIPFITGWAMSPDNVAASLASRDLSDKLKGVVAYQLIGNGELAKILPKEWDGIEADLQALSDKLKADEKIESESYRLWRRDSIPLLPAGVFVWKDEFDTAFARAYSPYHLTLLDERPGDRDLNFSPMIPLEIRATVFEGFNMPVETDVLASNVEGKMLPTFEKESATYPPELDIALQAWRAVSTTEGKAKPKARIKAWLKDNASNLSDEAKERIAIVANWDKTGGATKTQ